VTNRWTSHTKSRLSHNLSTAPDYNQLTIECRRVVPCGWINVKAGTQYQNYTPSNDCDRGHTLLRVGMSPLDRSCLRIDLVQGDPGDDTFFPSRRIWLVQPPSMRCRHSVFPVATDSRRRCTFVVRSDDGVTCDQRCRVHLIVAASGVDVTSVFVTVKQEFRRSRKIRVRMQVGT
jgi:hypothetical protein